MVPLPTAVPPPHAQAEATLAEASTALPPEAPMSMPTQSLTRFNRFERRKPVVPRLDRSPRLSRLFVWASRQVLAGLMRLGSALSGAMSRQMELDVDPSLPLTESKSMNEFMRASLATARMNTVLLSLLGGEFTFTPQSTVSGGGTLAVATGATARIQAALAEAGDLVNDGGTVIVGANRGHVSSVHELRERARGAAVLVLEVRRGATVLLVPLR